MPEEAEVPEAGRASRTDSVESLGRALAVLEIIDESSVPMTASEVSRAAGYALPITLRLLRSLTALGHLEHEDRRYRIAAGSLGLSWSYLAALSLESVLRPALAHAAHALQLPGFFSVLTLPNIYNVDMVLSEEWRSFTGGRAARAPAHATSPGLVLLAAMETDALDRYLVGQHRMAFTELTVVEPEALRERLAQVHKDGYAITDGEYVPGLRGAAVPVRNAAGTVIGTFSISTNAMRTPLDVVGGVVLDELRTAADTAHLHYRAQADAR